MMRPRRGKKASRFCVGTGCVLSDAGISSDVGISSDAGISIDAGMSIDIGSTASVFE
jgi:hypothetical protein